MADNAPKRTCFRLALPKYKCPCCGYYTLSEKAGGSFEICPVCFWEDDRVQLQNPDLAGGANGVSLNEAREQFRKCGASREDLKPYVRAPKKRELHGIE